MTDIIVYHASVRKWSRYSNEFVTYLPYVIEQRLHAVPARDIRVMPSIITFHGRLSRTVPRDGRVVTTWNLLSIVSRGAIRIEEDYPEVTVRFWLGFPKRTLAILVFMIMGMLLFLSAGMVSSGEPLTDIVLTVVLMGMMALLWLGVLPHAITIIRFHWFLRSCLRRAEREVKRSAAAPWRQA